MQYLSKFDSVVPTDIANLYIYKEIFIGMSSTSYLFTKLRYTFVIYAYIKE